MMKFSPWVEKLFDQSDVEILLEMKVDPNTCKRYNKSTIDLITTNDGFVSQGMKINVGVIEKIIVKNIVIFHENSPHCNRLKQIIMNNRDRLKQLPIQDCLNEIDLILNDEINYLSKSKRRRMKSFSKV